MSLIQDGGITNSQDIHLDPIVPGTTSVTNKQDGQGGGRLVTKDAQLLVNDGNMNRIMIGQRGDGTYGMQVSKPGFDVTSGNANQIMNSDFNMFKIVATGTMQLVVAGAAAATSYIVNMSNTLTYAPGFMVFWDFNSVGPVMTNLPFYQIFYDAAGTKTTFQYRLTAAATPGVTGVTLYTGDATGANGTYNFRYYIFQESAS